MPPPSSAPRGRPFCGAKRLNSLVPVERIELPTFGLQSPVRCDFASSFKLALGVKKPRAKPKPTHRGKKNRKFTWTGRALDAVEDAVKGLQLSDFPITKRRFASRAYTISR